MAHIKHRRTLRRRRNPSGIDLNLVLIGGVGYIAYKKGIFDSLLSSVGMGGGSTGNTGNTGGTGGSTTPTGPTAAEIQAWTQNTNVPLCVGQAFAAQFHRLPGSLDELVNWGNSTGIRHSDGTWHC